MKKKMLRKLREWSNEIVGEDETNKNIDVAIKEVLEETKPKPKKKKGVK